jgi:hypothetical protein
MKESTGGIGRIFEVLIVVMLILLVFIIFSMITGLIALPIYLAFRSGRDRRKVAFWATYLTVLLFLPLFLLYHEFFISFEGWFFLATFLGALCYLWMRKDAGLSVMNSLN